MCVPLDTVISNWPSVPKPLLLSGDYGLGKTQSVQEGLKYIEEHLKTLNDRHTPFSIELGVDSTGQLTLYLMTETGKLKNSIDKVLASKSDKSSKVGSDVSYGEDHFEERLLRGTFTP